MRSALVLGLFWLLLVVSPSARADAGDPIIGDEAPPAGDVALGADVVVVDFFATWCGPCHEAMVVLDELVRRRGVKLVVVDVGEPEERVKAYLAAHPLPAGARLVIDRDGGVGRRWGQHRFPTTFVVGDGKIRHINRGYGSGYALRLDRWIEGMTK